MLLGVREAGVRSQLIAASHELFPRSTKSSAVTSTQNTQKAGIDEGNCQLPSIRASTQTRFYYLAANRRMNDVSG